jgi:hypothetical protein
MGQAQRNRRQPSFGLLMIMDRVFYSSSSSKMKAKDDCVSWQWYTVAPVGHSRDKDEEPEDALKNPWNGDEAEMVFECPFPDQCVISIRPTKDHGRREYFLEISNQDESIRLSSRKIYEWEEVMKLASFFKEASFFAAQRIWKSKKL